MQLLNKLRFLFTSRLKVWRVQEHCVKDFYDCGDCGTGMWHSSSDHLTFRDAMNAAGEDILMSLYDDGETWTTREESKDRWIIESDGTTLWYEVYPVTIAF
jgi:hypothetical protein